MTDHLAEGSAALAARDAEAALVAFEAAGDSGPALYGLARAHHLGGDFEAALDAYERASVAFKAAGEALHAANAARAAAWLHLNVRDDWAVHEAWLVRARTLLEGAKPGSGAAGWYELLAGQTTDDPGARERHLHAAVETGRALNIPELEFDALGWIGVDRCFAGDHNEGMAIYDQAMLAIGAGELTDIAVVEGLFCGMFWLCERHLDLARAEQWLRAGDELIARRGPHGFAPTCRAHYAGILTAAGRWTEAEEHLHDAMHGGYAAMRARALVRLANLRVGQGRLDEAEQLLDGLDQHPDACLPLAALHVARGKTALARDLLERGVPSDTSDLAFAPHLSLLVEVLTADGAVDDALAVTKRLDDMAVQHRSPYIRAAAAVARGRVCIAAGTDDARACLSEAVSGFAAAHMPLELARARLDLARAVGADRPEVAVAEATEALRSFERLEASRHADQAAALLRELGAPARTGPKGSGTLTKRESEVLDLLGAGLTNPEISDRLYISRKTVEHHVSNVLAKLGLRSRAEAAAYVASKRGSAAT